MKRIEPLRGLSAEEALKKVTAFTIMELGNRVYGQEPVKPSRSGLSWSVPVSVYVDGTNWEPIGRISVHRNTGKFYFDRGVREAMRRVENED